MRTRKVGLLLVGVAIVGAGVLMWVLQPSSPAGRRSPVPVTLFPFPTAPATPAALVAAPLSTAAPLLPSPTPLVTQYVVQPGDTLWDIALRFGFTSLEAILAANPGLNPDFLSIGQVLIIPGYDFVPPPRPTAAMPPALLIPLPSSAGAPETVGFVLPDAGGLRLRRAPSYDAEVITRLGPNTPLRIFGPVAGQSWLRVRTPGGAEGYVDARYVSIGAASALPTPINPSAAQPAPIAAAPLEYPFLSDISPRVFEIFRAGQARGNRPNVFTLVGDSNSQHPAYLKPFDWGNYNLGAYAYLQPTVEFFRGSFAQESPAANGGFNTSKVLDPSFAPPSCGGRSPLQCAYDQMRPSIAFILLGTGDQHNWQNFEANYRRIVEITIGNGVIPVLITKGDDLECRDNNAPCGFINGKIAQIAAEYQVPLLNLRQIVQRLPNGGMTEDGFHYNFPPDNRSAWFTPEYLHYGYTQRNLTTLQTLDLLRRRVIAPGQ
ncbi:MAG: LysM peptidoglycan-binding domain-containing protein [Anaerolineae bacterium]|nr:LysM peptidoglycan-binding domain-containing protein [Thermoflexales bacterium]MDW8053002.1 LysM peptidoglycan-binding domain-containing protein [Anaerolineae bacterium]